MVGSLCFSQAAHASKKPAALPNVVCSSDGDNPVTIIKSGKIESDPIIIWKTEEFGSEWTPEQRCEEVSKNLDKILQTRKTLKNLDYKTGKRGRAPVMCYIPTGMTGKGCTASNHIMNLPSHIKTKAQQVQFANDFVSALKAIGTSDTPIAVMNNSDVSITLSGVGDALQSVVDDVMLQDSFATEDPYPDYDQTPPTDEDGGVWLP